MKAPSRRRSSAVSVIWFVAFTIVIAGYLFAFRLIEVRIDARLAQSARSAGQLRADERVVAERPRLAVERGRLRARLAPVALDDIATRLVARFVHDAARIAARNTTKITAIAAAAAAIPPRSSLSVGASPSSSPTQVLADRFQAIPLEVTLEGRYVNLLAALRELSATRALAYVELSSMARKNVDAPDVTLTAVLHVALERLAQPVPPLPAVLETHDVRTRPR